MSTTKLDFLLDQLNGLNWSNSYKLNVIREYEKFLFLRSQNENISPSNDVDIVWHQHILNTKHYRNYCYERFEHFVDHDPTDAFNQEERKKRLTNTYNLYITKYGEPDPYIWKEATSLILANKPLKNNIQQNKQNKKLIWYNNKQLYEAHKSGKELLKIIFAIKGISNYNNTTIMYLADNDVSLENLSDIIDQRIGNISQNYKIRWMTKDPLLSANFKTRTNSFASRHLLDLEPSNTKISYYYNNRIELIASYHDIHEGC